MSFLEGELLRLKNEQLYATKTIIDGPQSSWVTIQGQKKLMLSSNNYLGLSNHHDVKKAAREAIERFGVGLGTGRRIVSMSVQIELEEKLARLHGTDAAICFQTGYDANLGAISALMNTKDVIFSDELNHASIVDGARMSPATKRIYPHRDMEALEKLMKETKVEGKALVVTDAVFSMDGTTAPLSRIVELAKEHSAAVYLDEAHSFGVLGKHGHGLVEHTGLQGQVDIEMGTLSKALGIMGGYIAGTGDLADYLFQRTRPFIFGTGHLPPPVAAAIIAALDVMESEPALLKQLWNSSDHLKKGLVELGFNIGLSETPITPVIVREEKTAHELSRELYHEGVFVQAFTYPIVALGSARVRTIVSALHTSEDIEFAIRSFEKVGRKLGII